MYGPMARVSGGIRERVIGWAGQDLSCSPSGITTNSMLKANFFEGVLNLKFTGARNPERKSENYIIACARYIIDIFILMIIITFDK